MSAPRHKKRLPLTSLWTVALANDSKLIADLKTVEKKEKEAVTKAKLTELRVPMTAKQKMTAYQELPKQFIPQNVPIPLGFDFDFTTASLSIHNLISQLCPDGSEEEQWKVARAVAPMGGARLKAVFERLTALGVRIGILSRMEYPMIAYRYYKEIIGLSEECLNNLVFCCFDPFNPEEKDNSGKIQHTSVFLEVIGMPQTQKINMVDDTEAELDILRAANKLHHGIVAKTIGKSTALTMSSSSSSSSVVGASEDQGYPHLDDLEALCRQLEKELAGDASFPTSLLVERPESPKAFVSMSTEIQSSTGLKMKNMISTQRHVYNLYRQNMYKCMIDQKIGEYSPVEVSSIIQHIERKLKHSFVECLEQRNKWYLQHSQSPLMLTWQEAISSEAVVLSALDNSFLAEFKEDNKDLFAKHQQFSELQRREKEIDPPEKRTELYFQTSDLSYALKEAFEAELKIHNDKLIANKEEILNLQWNDLFNRPSLILSEKFTALKLSEQQIAFIKNFQAQKQKEIEEYEKLVQIQESKTKQVEALTAHLVAPLQAEKKIVGEKMDSTGLELVEMIKVCQQTLLDPQERIKKADEFETIMFPKIIRIGNRSVRGGLLPIHLYSALHQEINQLRKPHPMATPQPVVARGGAGEAVVSPSARLFISQSPAVASSGESGLVSIQNDKSLLSF